MSSFISDHFHSFENILLRHHDVILIIGRIPIRPHSFALLRPHDLILVVGTFGEGHEVLGERHGSEGDNKDVQHKLEA